MEQFVTYTRVSTKRQGRSGLGLEAQQRDMDRFLGGEVIEQVRLGQPGLRGDHVEGGATKAMLREDLERGIEDGFAVLLLNTRAWLLQSHAAI